MVAEIRAKIADSVTPEERAYYLAGISDADAIKDGARVESSAVLDEYLRIMQLALPSILAKLVPGYGPLRAAHVTDVALELAEHVTELDSATVDAAGAGAAKDVSLKGSRTLRMDALRALKNLAGRRKEERARIRQLTKGKENPDERSRSLDALAQEVEGVIAKTPARVLEDAGLTPELIKSLRSYAKAVLSAREKAHGKRGSIASLYDAMNVLDGRILHELRLLIGASRDARRSNQSVPNLRSKLIQRPRKKKSEGSEEGPEEGPKGKTEGPAAAPKGEPAKGEPAKGEPAKGEPARGEPAKSELAKGEPAKGEPAKSEPAKGEPARGELIAEPAPVAKPSAEPAPNA